MQSFTCKVECKLSYADNVDRDVAGGDRAGEPSSIAAAVLDLANCAPLRPSFCHLQLCASSPSVPEAVWFNWGQIAQWVFDACRHIEQLRLPHGSHIASVHANSADWIVLDLACQILGFVHVAIDHRWPDTTVARLLEVSESSRYFSSSVTPQADFANQRRAVQRLNLNVDRSVAVIRATDLEWLIERSRAVSSDASAQMLFTSGTSGEPKGVVLTHRNLVSNALGKLDAAPQFETDLRLNILPFCHAYARTCELSTWVLSKSRLAIATDWSGFLVSARRLQPTLVNLVPHLVNRLTSQSKQVNAPESVVAILGGKVRLLQVGGASLSDSLWYELAAAGLPPLQGYGLTEASPVVCSNRAGEQRPGTIGRAIKGVELKVDGERQLWVFGPNVMRGYYGDRQATQDRIRNGWLATGDLVEQDVEGHYRIIGRVSEVIVLSNGFKVSPELIEARLAAVPWIERVMIVGQDRPYIAAVLWPAWASLPDEFFSTNSQRSSSLDQAVMLAAVAKRFEVLLSDLPKFMRPRRFIVQHDGIGAIEADSELVNAKGVLRRRLVTEKLQPEIAKLYFGDKDFGDKDQYS